MLQWLRLCTSPAGDVVLIPGWGTKIPHATQPKNGKKKKKNHLLYIKFTHLKCAIQYFLAYSCVTIATTAFQNFFTLKRDSIPISSHLLFFPVPLDLC